MVVVGKGDPVVLTVVLLSIVVAVGAVFAVSQIVWMHRREYCFRCKIRLVGGWFPAYSNAWPRRTVRAEWAHDVLIVSRGRVFVRTDWLPTARAEGKLLDLTRREVSRLGPDPTALDVILDNGVRLRVAARAKNESLLCGPYLVAQVEAVRGTRRGR